MQLSFKEFLQLQEAPTASPEWSKLARALGIDPKKHLTGSVFGGAWTGPEGDASNLAQFVVKKVDGSNGEIDSVKAKWLPTEKIGKGAGLFDLRQGEDGKWREKKNKRKNSKTSTMSGPSFDDIMGQGGGQGGQGGGMGGGGLPGMI